MIAVYRDVDAACVDGGVDGNPKTQGIFIAHRAGPYRGVTLVFNRAIHKNMDDLARLLNKLGLNEVRVE
jgi:hypothetical protein